MSFCHKSTSITYFSNYILEIKPVKFQSRWIFWSHAGSNGSPLSLAQISSELVEDPGRNNGIRKATANVKFGHKIHKSYFPPLPHLPIPIEFLSARFYSRYRMFLEQWNKQKILSNIRQLFSCLLDEWIPRKCKKKNSWWLVF